MMTPYRERLPSNVVLVRASRQSLSPVSRDEIAVPYNATNDNFINSQLLCDWPRSVVDCRDSDFIVSMPIASAVFHFLLSFFGIGVIWLRSNGFKRSIMANFFKKVGPGFQPDIFGLFAVFSTIACFIKIACTAALVLHMSQWLCIELDQLYWFGVAIAITPFGAVALNTIPFTTLEGKFAIYKPGPESASFPQPAITFCYPTRSQTKVCIAVIASFALTCVLGVGIASGVFSEQDHYDLARALEKIEYFSLAPIIWLLAAILLYYGYKVKLILRVSISTEATCNVTLHSRGERRVIRSPARPLSILTQIMAFGTAFVFILAGSLCAIWARWKDRIRSAEDTRWPHVMACLWTCANGVTILVALLLVVTFFNIRRTKPQDCKESSQSKFSKSAADDLSDFDNAAAPVPHSVALHSDAYQTNGNSHLDRDAEGGELRDSALAGSMRKNKDRQGSLSVGTAMIGKNANIDHNDRNSLPTEVCAEDFPPPPMNKRSIAALSPLSTLSLYGMPTARERKLQDIQAFQLQYQSAQRRVQWLHFLKQQQSHPEESQRQLHALELELQEVHQQLQRLEAAKGQYLQSQELLQTVDKHDLKASIRDVCLLSDMRILELQVESSLHQLIQHTESYIALAFLPPHHPRPRLLQTRS